jgi:chromosome segregation ATPase
MQQVVGHLHEERQRLLVDLIDQKSACSAAQAETERLRGQVADLLRDKEAFEGSEQRASTMAASYSEQLKRELDDCKRELDLSVVECNNLRAEIASREQRATASREMQAKLEMENHQLSDELDVARDQAAKLSKAEAQLDKYQHRLEELPNLRKENKDLLERLDQYLDKVQELENANKSASTLGRMVEQYKDRAVEMERQKFEAMSALQMQSAELERLRVEAEDQSEARDSIRKDDKTKIVEDIEYIVPDKPIYTKGQIIARVMRLVKLIEAIEAGEEKLPECDWAQWPCGFWDKHNVETGVHAKAEVPRADDVLPKPTALMLRALMIDWRVEAKTVKAAQVRVDKVVELRVQVHKVVQLALKQLLK